MPSEQHRVTVVAGGAVGVLGATLPWVVGVGFELDVYSVYALAASAAVVTVAVGTWSRRTQLVTGALAAATTGFALEAIVDFAGDGPPPGIVVGTSTPGVGAYLALAGGVLALAGATLARTTS
jgi:hypothetical protein